MSIQIYGFSVHYYDAKANSDKFYRAFVWFDGLWRMAKHWGRDGSAGTTDVIAYPSENAARVALARKLTEELKKGYELLGQGFVDIHVDRILGSDIQSTSARLHDWVGRPPTKLPDGYVFIIREEPDLEDLLV